MQCFLQQYNVSVPIVTENVFKNILSQSVDQFNGQIKYYLKISTLLNHLHSHHASLIDTNVLKKLIEL